MEVDSHENRLLRDCLRKLGLPVVHVTNDAQVPGALQEIFKTRDVFPPFKLRNVLSAITRTGVKIGSFGALDNNQRNICSMGKEEY